MKKWFRLILEIILFAGLVGTGVFIYLQNQDISELENQISQIKTNDSAAATSKPTNDLRLKELLKKEKELAAVKAALNGGQALQDVEAAAKSSKIESPERYLAIGALRLLVKGKDDPSAAEAFEKALEMNQWNVRLKSVCAAQAGMAASGLEVDMLSDCDRVEQITNEKVGSSDNKTQPRNDSNQGSITLDENSQAAGI
ncbi:MAG: hypothetical protein CBC42_00450 [Betaproteobacteria bacterium TMED82]|nr:MAG: hypothetical protein CBC42_00450 [Betaproteobacteria bacterium TMED82]|tara:strand:- start:20231 stop:20827 length:597 start_codon:yes stop_codon:yes gene_type:complete